VKDVRPKASAQGAGEDRALDAAPARSALPPRMLWLLAGMTLGWGLSWPIMKVVLGQLEPLRFRALTAASGLALLAIAAFQRQPLRVPAGQWPRLVAVSLFNITGWGILAMYGLQAMPSGRAVIITYTMPVWAVVFGAVFAREAITARRALGVALGMTGMLLLVSGEFQALQRAPLGLVCLIGAAVSWAIATVMLRHWPVALPGAALTGWQVLIGGVPIWIATLLLDHGRWLPSGASTWLALGYTLCITTIFCLWAFTRIATEAPVAVSSLSTLMIPVIGVLSGMAMLGETPRWHDVAALVFVFAALVTVLLPSRTRGPA
jgi:drug/metabolite transporter (DMT)-like permease